MPAEDRGLNTTAAAPAAADVSHAEGSCFCGAIRFRMPLPPLWVAHCHCTMCRRAQGAAFVTWLGTDGARFEFIGAADTLRQHASSPGAIRSFCGRCGTP